MLKKLLLPLAFALTTSASSFAMQNNEQKSEQQVLASILGSMTRADMYELSKTLAPTLAPILAKELKSTSLNELTDLIEAMKSKLELLEKDARSAKRWSKFMGIVFLVAVSGLGTTGIIAAIQNNRRYQ